MNEKTIWVMDDDSIITFMPYQTQEEEPYTGCDQSILWVVGDNYSLLMK